MKRYSFRVSSSTHLVCLHTAKAHSTLFNAPSVQDKRTTDCFDSIDVPLPNMCIARFPETPYIFCDTISCDTKGDCADRNQLITMNGSSGKCPSLSLHSALSATCYCRTKSCLSIFQANTRNYSLYMHSRTVFM